MNRFKLSLVSVVVVCCAFALQQGCVSHDFPTYRCSGETVSFTNDIQPIINAKCAIPDCHGYSPEIPDWTDFGTFQEEARSGNVKNYVVNRIMPPAYSPQGPLSQEQINLISCWIDQGALEN